MTWKYRFSRMKKHYAFSYEKLAEMLGVKADSIRAVVTKMMINSQMRGNWL